MVGLAFLPSAHLVLALVVWPEDSCWGVSSAFEQPSYPAVVEVVAAVAFDTSSADYLPAAEILEVVID